MFWTKESDWLPYTNALAQVNFWKDDLIKIERSLRILEIMNVPETDPGYKMTLRERNTSRNGLKLAQIKLKEALDRLTKDDIINFRDKLGIDG